jgi:hypothetical protein
MRLVLEIEMLLVLEMEKLLALQKANLYRGMYVKASFQSQN